MSKLLGSKVPEWRVGFEIEIILGDLGDERLERELATCGPMDKASIQFCRTLARRLSETTGRRWMAGAEVAKRPGFYVVPEYDLDPLRWPDDRLAGVELLTPPLPIYEAELVKNEIIEAIEDLDGYFNFVQSEYMQNCAWHINIDAGPHFEISPIKFSSGVDEIGILIDNGRLFNQYAGIQRHSFGIPLLHLLMDGRVPSVLNRAMAERIIHHFSGRGKQYAANFSKIERGYLELRHFSTSSFFSDVSLLDRINPIINPLNMSVYCERDLAGILLEKFKILSTWLYDIESEIRFQFDKSKYIPAMGSVFMSDEPIGYIRFDGLSTVDIATRKPFEISASIKLIQISDVQKAVALMALDLAELKNMGVRVKSGHSKKFQRAISQLASQLKSNASLSRASVEHMILQDMLSMGKDP
ncbi:MAG: amidoligase family protein [Rhizobiales bacterium]|nr:amidoligase family protein [Hyphomicrobiales bacterium]